jgi:hypothetical protein
MPRGSQLIGKSGDHGASTIAAAPFSTQPWGNALPQRYPNNNVLEVSDDNTVQDLSLTGDGQLHADCCTTVVAIVGSRSVLNNVEIFDLDPQARRLPLNPSGGKPAGVYFIGSSTSSENVINNAFIHDLRMGTIFRAGLPVQHANTVSNSEMFGISCDSITFSGYGIARNNFIHGNGFDCGQQPIPIPGGGFYTFNNRIGGQIIGNTITDVCGNGLDLVDAENFVIENNRVHLERTPFGGKYSYCVGGSAGSFVDIRNFKITGNTFKAINIPPLGPSLALFPAYAADFFRAYYPLPEKAKQVIAVKLLKYKSVVTNNTFENNTMIGRCDTISSCVGIGLYVGPGTGVDGNGKWSASTSNYFTKNSVVGSNIGSLRCGADWYAADSICTEISKGSSCNDDDSEHVPGVNANWSRNDVCAAP